MASQTPKRQARRMACVLCRDRKVKCDGTRPSCTRCVKGSEDCVYPSGIKASKADMQEMLDQLHERLRQTEANTASILAQHRPGTSSGAGGTSALATQATPSEHMRTDDGTDPFSLTSVSLPIDPAIGPPSPQWAYLDMDVDSNTSGRGSLSNPSLDAIGSSNDFDFPEPSKLLTEGPDGTHPHFRCAYTYPLVFNMDESKGKASTASRPFTHITPTHSRLPSLRDLRDSDAAANTLEKVDGGSSNSDKSETSGPHQHLLQEYISLITSVNSAQQSIVGIASAVGRYARYYRRLDADARSAEQLDLFLSTLDARMSEISNIGTHQVLFHLWRSRDAVSRHRSFGAHMGDLGEKQSRQAELMAEFFQLEYDVSRLLALQEPSHQ